MADPSGRSAAVLEEGKLRFTSPSSLISELLSTGEGVEDLILESISTGSRELALASIQRKVGDLLIAREEPTEAAVFGILSDGLVACALLRLREPLAPNELGARLGVDLISVIYALSRLRGHGLAVYREGKYELSEAGRSLLNLLMEVKAAKVIGFKGHVTVRASISRV